MSSLPSRSTPSSCLVIGCPPSFGETHAISTSTWLPPRRRAGGSGCAGASASVSTVRTSHHAESSDAAGVTSPKPAAVPEVPELPAARTRKEYCVAGLRSFALNSSSGPR
eukprot:76870-Pleurochrysis_carterae.AAC.4